MPKETEEVKISKNGHRSEHMIPGQVEVEVPGFTVGDKVNEGIKRGGLGNLIEKLQEQEKHIIAVKKPGKMVLYVGSSLALLGTLAGGVYLNRKRRRG